ncbi:HNH endonuclease [Mesorhizobium plurifarium]|uniref:HNH endonuclease n=1 Tax=Sinorhizobium arboris TaxID=76745 RepID=UPI000480E1F0|nr:HNH endonuclease [Sinorhizobium arboris]PST20745.1 HNH endonuclease [Mesorhizobium plurifarium]
MRRVNRNAVAAPASLTNPSAAVSTERSEAVAHYAATTSASYEFSKYKEFDVKFSLDKLFDNKCAYCEHQLGDGMEVEHFRPKGRVDGEPTHRGYWWLALQWENLLPSCAGCNQRRCQHLVTVTTTEAEYAALQGKKPRKTAGKGNHFPISGVRAFAPTDSLPDEDHDILDPTVDDPGQYLTWSTSTTFSIALPLTTDPAFAKRALATINVFALNRTKLVQLRTGLLRELRLRAVEIENDLAEDAANGGSQFAVRNALRGVDALRRYCEPDKPFSAMARVFVENFANRLSARVAGMQGTEANESAARLADP